MLIRISEGSPAPLFAQIAVQIRAQIAEGRIREGERLPAARDLADMLGVNMHTVLRAYGDLRAEGLLELRQGRGATVTRGGAVQARKVLDLASSLVREAKRQGISRMELLAILEGMA